MCCQIDKRETNSDHEMGKDNLPIFTFLGVLKENYYSLRLSFWHNDELCLKWWWGSI